MKPLLPSSLSHPAHADYPIHSPLHDRDAAWKETGGKVRLLTNSAWMNLLRKVTSSYHENHLPLSPPTPFPSFGYDWGQSKNRARWLRCILESRQREGAFGTPKKGCTDIHRGGCIWDAARSERGARMKLQQEVEHGRQEQEDRRSEPNTHQPDHREKVRKGARSRPRPIAEDGEGTAGEAGVQGAVERKGVVGPPQITSLSPAIANLQVAESERRKIEANDKGWNVERLAQRLNALTATSQHVTWSIIEVYAMAHEQIGEQGFRRWVEKCGKHSYSTACAFLQVYRKLGGCRELVDTVRPTLLIKMCADVFPKDVRTKILDAGLVEDVTVKELAEVQNKINAGEWTIDSPEVQAVFKKREPKRTREEWMKTCRAAVREVQEVLTKNYRALEEAIDHLDDDDRAHDGIKELMEEFGKLNARIGSIVGESDHRTPINRTEEQEA